MKKIAVFGNTRSVNEAKLYPKEMYHVINSVQDIRGREFQGAIFLDRWFLDSAKTEAADLLKERHPEIFVEKKNGFVVIAFPLTRDEVTAKMDRGEFLRAGGDVICTVCGCPYRIHPHPQGETSMNEICSGIIVKL